LWRWRPAQRRLLSLEEVQTELWPIPPSPSIWRDSRWWARASLSGFTITLSETYHIQYDSLGRVISPLQRTLFYNRQHCQQDAGIHASRLDPNQQSQRRLAVDTRLRPRGHWNKDRYLE
jgi:hypothetical protein